MFMPPLASGALPGVTRAVVLEICDSLNIARREKPGNLATLKKATGVFLTLSSSEIVEVGSIDGTPLNRSPLIERLTAAYREVVDHETGG